MSRGHWPRRAQSSSRNACPPHLEWRFSGICADSLLGRPHGGFVDAERPAPSRRYERRCPEKTQLHRVVSESLESCPSCNGRHMARDHGASRRSRHPAGARAAVGDFLHVCATDGVFTSTADGPACDAPPVFLPVQPITQADLATLTERVRRRVIRWLRLNRLLDAAAAAEYADRAHRPRCAELRSELGASPAVLSPGHPSHSSGSP